jgi:hypothetical protein
MELTCSDSGAVMNNTLGGQSDRQLRFLEELVADNATVAADIAKIGAQTWAIHGVIPVDGDVIMAEFDTYCEARVVLDQLATDGPRTV